MRDPWICQSLYRHTVENRLGSVAWPLLAALLLLSGMSGAQAQLLADEDRDWGVAPVASLRQPPYSAPTPMNIPGKARYPMTRYFGAPNSHWASVGGYRR